MFRRRKRFADESNFCFRRYATEQADKQIPGQRAGVVDLHEAVDQIARLWFEPLADNFGVKQKQGLFGAGIAARGLPGDAGDEAGDDFLRFIAQTEV